MRLISRTGRIGLLGGTFDPIHCGHIETVQAAQGALALSPVLLMPARIPPHRERGPSASTFHRFAMAALAASELDDVLASDDELLAEGPSYTALTRSPRSRAGTAILRSWISRTSWSCQGPGCRQPLCPHGCRR